MVELNKEYTLKNGTTILIDGLSTYSEFNGKPVDIYTSNSQDGCWNKKGLYIPGVLFNPGVPNDMDILK